MPTFVAAFSETRRKWLASLLSVVGVVAALGACPLGIYSMGVRSYFFSEAHYFIRESATFFIKGGFGWCAFLTIPIFVVCVCISFMCWYNSTESRRMDTSLFNLIMTVLMWLTLALWGACGYTVVSMLISSFHFHGILEKGIRRAMTNYDKFPAPDPKYPRDKSFLDDLHVSKQCCGVGGWQSFQAEAIHLKEISRVLVKQNGFDTSFQCSNNRWCYVPASCCRQTIAWCSNQDFDLGLDHPSRAATLFDDGCDEKLTEIFQPIFEVLGYIYLAYFIIFYIFFIGCRFFHTSVMLSIEYSVPLTPGYVFPCGYESKDELMEMFLKHETNLLYRKVIEQENQWAIASESSCGMQSNTCEPDTGKKIARGKKAGARQRIEFRRK